MSLWAKAGVKCVCIRNVPWIDASTLSIATNGPAMDEICTIETVIDHPLHGVGLCLFGHPEPRGGRAVFPIRFFRPLVQQDQDLAHFTHHLDRVGEPA